jgi:hypothetical protein
MEPDSASGQATEIQRGEERDYEAPAVVVLGTFAELTQGFDGPVDDLLNSGSVE